MQAGRVERMESQVLGRTVRLWLLDTPETKSLVYLLHGNGGCCLDWAEHTDLVALAARHRLAVVAPDFEDSYCTNTADGRPWFDYLSNELPELAQGLLGRSFTPQQTFMVGLSAGGYGALKLAFGRPERFGGCVALSAVTDMAARIALLPPQRLPQFRPIFGEALAIASENDLPRITRSAAARGTMPPLFLACGTGDSFLPMNEAYHQLLEKLGVEHQFHTAPGGHEWRFWQTQLPVAMDWIGQRLKMDD